MSSALSHPTGSSKDPSYINFLLTLNDIPLQVRSFKVTGGSFGSVGRLEAVTTRAYLQAARIDLYNLTIGSGRNASVALIGQAASGPQIHLFGGEFLSYTVDYDSDCVTMTCRDWAGVLVDQRRVLVPVAQTITGLLAPLEQLSSTGVEIQNQTIEEVVSSIATTFGFTPVFNLAGPTPKVGTVYGSSDSVFMQAPMTLWSVLNRLALLTGYEVYVTPNKKLVFGIPGAGLPSLTFGYKLPASTYTSNRAQIGSTTEPVNESMQLVPHGVLPCKHLQVTLNPRRNSAFRVVVISYDAAKAATVTGYAAVVPPGFPGIAAGIYVGSQALSISAEMQAAVEKYQVGPALYTFHVDGLTQSQANDRAKSIGNDIAKRASQIALTVDGIPSLRQTQSFTAKGDIDQPFLGMSWNVSAFQHSFKMGHNMHDHDGGFFTHIKGWNVQLESYT